MINVKQKGKVSVTNLEQEFYDNVRNFLRLFTLNEGYDPSYVTRKMSAKVGFKIIQKLVLNTDAQINLTGESKETHSRNPYHTKFLSNLSNIMSKEMFAHWDKHTRSLSFVERIISFNNCILSGFSYPPLGITSEHNCSLELFRDTNTNNNTFENLFDESLYLLIQMFVAKKGLNIELVDRKMVKSIGTMAVISEVNRLSNGKISFKNVRSSLLPIQPLEEVEKLHLKYLEALLENEMDFYLSFKYDIYGELSLVDRVLYLVNTSTFGALQDPLEIAKYYYDSFPEYPNGFKEFIKRNYYLPGEVFKNKNTGEIYELIQTKDKRYNLKGSKPCLVLKEDLYLADTLKSKFLKKVNNM